MDYINLETIIANTRLAPLLAFTELSYLEQLKHGDFHRWRSHLKKFPDIEVSDCNFGNIVRIGGVNDVNHEIRSFIQQLLFEMVPWRKGPFEVLGISIDSEWRSNLKWSRLKNQIASLSGKKVLDVGCGNGYYGFRMLQQKPEVVIGIEPHLAYVTQFWALKQFTPRLPVSVLPCTLEQIPGALHGFDSVFSMGVIYHRRSPIDHLMHCKQCLAPGGQLILESLYVDGPAGYSLMPPKSYGRMSNVWFLPSIGTLEQWLTRCGFKNIEVINESNTTTEEQRKTEWMPYASLGDAIDKSDPSKTIEGFPAPKRTILLADLAS